MQSGSRLERQVSLDEHAELAGQLIGRRDEVTIQSSGSELAVIAGRFHDGDRFLPARCVRNLDEDTNRFVQLRCRGYDPIGVPRQVIEIAKGRLDGYDVNSLDVP